MGRIRTPRYAIEFTVDRGHWTPARWQSQYAGRPTDANLAKHCLFYETSTQPGGCNAHLGATTILAARIVRNDGSRALVARYQRAS